MKRPPKRSKTKRKIAVASVHVFDKNTLEKMAQDSSYIPSPYHKSNPAAWGISEPPQHRPDKTVCEGSGITSCRDAEELLKSGFRRGMVSVHKRNNWPQNVWAVDAEGIVYEAQLTNSGLGEYHGYPMTDGDSFTKYVGTEWVRRSQ